jgi:mRNA-degrading endonuclease RelE of RelBE toxin-antitoxin system
VKLPNDGRRKFNEMRFIETSVFTRSIVELLGDDDYRGFQLTLLFQPQLGSVIPGSGGLRKIRWSVPGRGKRGGIRVIYYWHERTETFYLLYVYRKNERENLTAQQLRLLSQLVREEFG